MKHSKRARPGCYDACMPISRDRLLNIASWSGVGAVLLATLLVFSARWFWLGEIAASFAWQLGWASLLGAAVLAITGSSPHDAMVAAADADPELVAAVKAALIDFDPQRDLGVDVVGEVEKISGFADGTDADYDELRRALAESQGDP